MKTLANSLMYVCSLSGLILVMSVTAVIAQGQSLPTFHVGDKVIAAFTASCDESPEFFLTYTMNVKTAESKSEDHWVYKDDQATLTFSDSAQLSIPKVLVWPGTLSEKKFGTLDILIFPSDKNPNDNSQSIEIWPDLLRPHRLVFRLKPLGPECPVKITLLTINGKDLLEYTRLMAERGCKSEEMCSRTIDSLTKAIELGVKSKPAYDARSDSYSARASLRADRGDSAGAIADYTHAIKDNSRNYWAYRDFAWLLSTNPQPKYRNGRKAIEYATRAWEYSDYEFSDFMETVAAAYAEAGEFAEAIKWQNKALQSEGLKDEYGVDARKRLRLYTAHQPYRKLK